MPLNANAQAAISAVSPDDVARTLGGLRSCLGKSTWIGPRNRYSRDTINAIEAETRGGGIRRPRQLAQYIAASCLLHSADGWSYLGRSIVSLLRGDPHRARHLAYYAELRAAMSLLATQGIGIFNRRHFAVDAPNSASPIQQQLGTHEFAWDCLQFWSGLPTSGSIFSGVIRPHGRTLDDWFAPLGGSAAVAPQAQVWLRQWGMDLNVLANDRTARNESSYRPDGIPSSWSLDTSHTLAFVRDIWRALEPSKGSLFEEIDRHILRIAFETSYFGRTGRKPEEDLAAYKAYAGRAINSQGFTPETTAQWEQFLLRAIAPNDLTVLTCSAKAPDTQTLGHASVIARATLLLRVASGATVQLLRSAGVNSNSVRFWIDNTGRSRGLWDDAIDTDKLTDLWADIERILEDIDQFQVDYTQQQQTFYRVGNEMPGVITGLGSCERVAIWSMTP
jgi:hypothetical protein